MICAPMSALLRATFVKGANQSINQGAGALVPEWATAQHTGELLAHLECWRAHYHFCRPHSSLRRQLDVPQQRRGKQTPCRYTSRTPATLAPHASAGVAAGLTDHIWSVEELLAFPVGQ
jgi:hypothetical protein